MGPQPGSDALLAKENLRCAVSGDLRRSTGRRSPLRGYENGKSAMKTEFSCVRDAAHRRDPQRY